MVCRVVVVAEFGEDGCGDGCGEREQRAGSRGARLNAQLLQATTEPFRAEVGAGLGSGEQPGSAGAGVLLLNERG